MRVIFIRVLPSFSQRAIRAKGVIMEITRREVQTILKQHGWEFDSITAWWPDTGRRDETSTFNNEMGMHEFYKLSEIKSWLGY